MNNLLQKFADSIINKMEKTTNEELIEFYYEFGMFINNVSIKYFKIYLK